MGRDHNEGDGRKPRRKAQQAATPDFWSFHPTEADKRALEAFSEDVDDIYQALEEESRRGIVFTITRTKSGDAPAVIARNRFDSYGDGQALSVFHASIERALMGMLYVLRVKWPAWPEKRATSTQSTFDW